jgi:hypothetical protein
VELVIRFVLGGLVVSAFAAIGEIFKPKTFSGLFGAAPSVAIASLALAFHRHGGAYVVTEAKSMIIGCAGMFLYCAACVAFAKRRHIPVWLGAGLSWVAWFAATFTLFALVRETGVLS